MPDDLSKPAKVAVRKLVHIKHFAKSGPWLPPSRFCQCAAMPPRRQRMPTSSFRNDFARDENALPDDRRSTHSLKTDQARYLRRSTASYARAFAAQNMIADLA